MGALASIVLAFGLAFIYAAQKIWVEGGAHQALQWLGIAALVASTAWRAYEWSRAKGTAKVAEQRLLIAHAGVVISVILFAATTEWGLKLLGVEGESKVPTILTVLWPSVLSVAGLALLFMELVYRRMPVAEAIELRRIASAAFDGMSIGLALVFAISINYAAQKRDIRKDVSYFRTAQPSEGTQRLVKSTTEPIKAVLFFPKTNEVLTEVRPYFDTLHKVSKNFTFEVLDHALAPELTHQHRVKDNGMILLLKGPSGHGQQGEQIDIGTDLQLARSKLRTLDGRFQQTFTTLARAKREIYFTVGHSERSDNSFKDVDQAGRASELIKALEQSNVRMKDLGINQGLASKVPDKAPAVAILGPRTPFLPEEAQSLLRYVRGGGRLLVMVDPTDDHGLTELLAGVGVELDKGVLTSESNFIARTHTEADRAIVFTKKYSAHPTVTIASRHQAQVATIFINGGALKRKEGAEPKGTKVLFPIRSDGTFWLDQNQDFTLNDPEKRGVQNMMAAITVPVDKPVANAGKDQNEGRVVVIADADFATDQVIRNPGNVLVINDILQWFLGQEQIVGQVSSEEDIPIEHTREQDKVWFYGTSLGVPLPIFALGIWVALRRRRRRRQAAPAPAVTAQGAAS